MLRRTFYFLALPTDKKAFMELVKTLRYRTEAPITDCTAALKETDGDMDAAMEALRKRGAARAMKKGDRVTEHGFVVSCVGSTPASGAAIITVCSETDFAARSDHFQRMCIKARDHLRGLLDETKGTVLADPEQAVKQLSEIMVDEVRAGIAVLGENVRVRSVVPLRPAPHAAEHLLIGSYTHGSLNTEDVGRIVGLVAVSQTREDEVISKDVLTSVGRHFVATSGAEGNYAHQNFFGSETETVGKWLKQHRLKFSSSVVQEFGKEPVVHTAPEPHS
ncbi:putative mitochondrial elongation factor ts, putative (EF-TS) [Leptomonas pyrrhocoris]|uniref:Elongation factor Ts, mitochondrial n=1 Tax=Leptomonas pyrrhocoris TaxID=157538 RepID=A0A0M9G1F1_LEPPY|nr:putative mitochondrial elongation factor ts, putative (EF-TS) [Leptomonas pyrrhocoris]XP_015658825.1 putative mitochondrial elongation factor ts, putative (EF-TS) [Leptomonas pyrrhocoris]KPA80385.1 putative mitochondrial elongation factor ts, putative (EF-TS) [Leptomonas pyrrhocoris]KPA80386.1 putative mitochondrial elongation factor ts, putative (EF-TS) [Leptomonas pyrrhocoris]|eukprot:XP_015658824.1 putative mitochondrial elongation factor ts, putative (EF-TS) [Leptomonas pyrrhocoris]